MLIEPVWGRLQAQQQAACGGQVFASGGAVTWLPQRSASQTSSQKKPALGAGEKSRRRRLQGLEPVGKGQAAWVFMVVCGVVAVCRSDFLPVDFLAALTSFFATGLAAGLDVGRALADTATFLATGVAFLAAAGFFAATDFLAGAAFFAAGAFLAGAAFLAVDAFLAGADCLAGIDFLPALTALEGAAFLPGAVFLLATACFAGAAFLAATGFLAGMGFFAATAFLAGAAFLAGIAFFAGAAFFAITAFLAAAFGGTGFLAAMVLAGAAFFTGVAALAAGFFAVAIMFSLSQ